MGNKCDFCSAPDPSWRYPARGFIGYIACGIAGESVGVVGVPPAADSGPFEHAFGRSPNRHGLSVATLAADPGAAWDYAVWRHHDVAGIGSPRTGGA